MAMSFFSTTDTTELDEVDVEKYVSKELIEQVISNLFKNHKVKKQLRKMIVDVISEMEWNDFKLVRREVINDCET